MATIGTTTAIAILPPDDRPELFDFEFDAAKAAALDEDDAAAALDLDAEAEAAASVVPPAAAAVEVIVTTEGEPLPVVGVIVTREVMAVTDVCDVSVVVADDVIPAEVADVLSALETDELVIADDVTGIEDVDVVSIKLDVENAEVDELVIAVVEFDMLSCLGGN